MNNMMPRDRRIYEALDGIEEKYIAEVTENYEIFDQNTGAAMSSRAKRKFYAKIAAAAACLVLVAGLMSAAPTILQRLNAIIPATSVAGTEQSEINSELLNDQTELEAVVTEAANDLVSINGIPYWSNLSREAFVIAEIKGITDETHTINEINGDKHVLRKVMCKVLYSRRDRRFFDEPKLEEINEIFVAETSVDELMKYSIILFKPGYLYSSNSYSLWLDVYNDDGIYRSIFYPINDGIIEIKETDYNFNPFLFINHRIDACNNLGSQRFEGEEFLPSKPLQTGSTIEEIIDYFYALEAMETSRDPEYPKCMIIKNYLN